METWAERAYPDNEAMAKIIEEFASMDENARLEKSRIVRDGAISRYDWDDCARVWEMVIDAFSQKKRSHEWDSPANILPNVKMPNIETNEDFVTWCLAGALKKPSRINRHEYHMYCKNLEFGCLTDSQLEPFNRHSMLDYINNKINENNFFESIRTGQRQPEQIDYTNGK